MTLSFDATVQVAQATHCSEAWVDSGGNKTSNDLIAKILVGAPAFPYCTGPLPLSAKVVRPTIVAAESTNTFTCSVPLSNPGTQLLHVSQIIDLLSTGFTYVSGTTSGSISTANPSTSYPNNGSQRQLVWNINPKLSLASGASSTLTFHATATLALGTYWNQAWVAADVLADQSYTWRTAQVQSMAVVHSTASAGNR